MWQFGGFTKSSHICSCRVLIAIKFNALFCAINTSWLAQFYTSNVIVSLNKDHQPTITILLTLQFTETRLCNFCNLIFKFEVTHINVLLCCYHPFQHLTLKHPRPLSTLRAQFTVSTNFKGILEAKTKTFPEGQLPTIFLLTLWKFPMNINMFTSSVLVLLVLFLMIEHSHCSLYWLGSWGDLPSIN